MLHARNVFINSFSYTIQKYHKSAFEAEKAEIKKALADKESEIEKHTKQSDTLRMKIERKIEQYRQEFKKLKNIGKTMKEVSSCSSHMYKWIA